MTSHARTAKSEKQRDPDLVNAEVAMKRAAQKARENARRYGVSVVIMRDGKIIEDREPLEIPKDL